MTKLRSLLINKQSTPEFVLMLPPEGVASYNGPCGVFIRDRVTDPKAMVWRGLTPDEETSLRNDVWEWASPSLQCNEQAGVRRYITLDGAKTLRRSGWDGWFEVVDARETLKLEVWLVAVLDHLEHRPGGKMDEQGRAGWDISRPWRNY